MYSFNVILRISLSYTYLCNERSDMFKMECTPKSFIIVINFIIFAPNFKANTYTDYNFKITFEKIIHVVTFYIVIRIF